MDDAWKDAHYDEAYQRIAAYLAYRHREEGEGFRTVARQMLEAAQVRLGNDQEGRGLAAELELEATIAAFEAFLAE